MTASDDSFTDEEYALLRHVRFGELPPAVRPDERITSTETDHRQGRPDPVSNHDQRVLRLGPGNG